MAGKTKENNSSSVKKSAKQNAKNSGSKLEAKTEDYEEVGKKAASNKKVLAKCLTALAEGSRRERQQAASAIHVAATISPERLVENADEIADALNRPEAQTRWECMRALTQLVPAGYKPRKAAFEAACDALYDENSGIVREAAFTFLCAYGTSGKAACEKSWKHIDEAIQCYHGNDEFNDMLTSLVKFAEEIKSKDIKSELAQRMAFDAENAKGTLKMRSVQIVEICKSKK